MNLVDDDASIPVENAVKRSTSLRRSKLEVVVTLVALSSAVPALTTNVMVPIADAKVFCSDSQIGIHPGVRSVHKNVCNGN